jgi:hypothetical protein
LALTGLLLLSSAARAGIVHVSGDTASSTSGIGDFTATLNYTATDGNNATLVVTLNNTTLVPGLYITAFALNNPGNAITGITIPDDADLFLLGDPSFQNDVNGSPFGRFDFGVGIGDGFQGEGNPEEDGLPVGEIGVVTFSLTGNGLDLIDAIDFTTELSVPPGQGQGPEFMLVRFRANEEDEEGDMVPADVNATINETPEPSTLLLTVLGLAGVPLWRARRRS